MVVAAVVRLVLTGAALGYLVLAPARRAMNPPVVCVEDWKAGL
jgi:hypothetical protein